MSYKMWSGKWHNLLPLPDLNGIPGRTFDVHTSLEFANILGNLVQQTSKRASKQHQQSEIALISRIFSAMMNCYLQNSKNKYIVGTQVVYYVPD